jgi:hypothetical protein
MIVDDQTFDRIEATAKQKTLDGRQIRVPDAIHLIALKLHTTRDTARRTTETDWEDIVSLIGGTNRSLEDPEMRLMIAQLEDPQPLPRSTDISAIRDNPDLLSLTTPREPLRECTEQEIKPSVMIAEMETMIRAVQSRPDFET